MTPDEARAELQRRSRRRAAMLANLLPEQQQALADPALLKALFCTRRAGKSWAIGTILFLTALTYPMCSCLYTGLTRDSARRIMNKDILRVLNERYAIGAVWKDSKSSWVLPNGSIIYLQGADANAYEWSKTVGQKYRVAVLDEASKYRQDLNDAVYGALMPAMGDDLGTIFLSGTPSNITTGLFYDVTTGREPGWRVHSWNWRDNRFARDNVAQVHDGLVLANPAIVETPRYKQEWLGQWVVDTSALVYKYDEARNVVAQLPRKASEYTYVLGADLGFSDPSALVVGAYSDHDPVLYVVHAAKHPGVTISTLAELIRSLWYMPSMGCRGPYPFSAMVADASALQAVEEMRQHHHLPLEAAQKPGKHGVIEVLNSDLVTGRVKFLPGPAEILGEEMGSLIWNPKYQLPKAKPSDPQRYSKYEEDPRFPNHATDAMLYMWRKARAYDALPEATPPPKPLTPEWEAARMEREIAKIERVKREGPWQVDEMPAWMGGD